MELNKECMEILRYMIEKDDYIKVEELAKKYKITDRAIRYKIDKIENFLVKNGFEYFDKKYGQGIKVTNSKEVKVYIERFTSEYTPYKYAYSKEERILFMTLRLLQENENMKIKEFEEKLCISKNTLLKEFDVIQENLKKYNLNLVRKPGVGLIVEGLEIDKRNAVIDIISESVSVEEVVNYASKKSSQSKISMLQFDALFKEIDIDFIDELIKNAEVKLKREFSDEAYGGLITHLAIMIKRVQIGKVLSTQLVNYDFVKETLEYEVTKDIIKKIEDKYQIKVPNEEISYIVIHLLGAKVVNNNFLVNKNEDNKLLNIIDFMTKYIESYYKIDLDEERVGLYDGLLLHLRPSLYRVKYGSKIINPLFERIKSEQSRLFKVVTTACKYLEEYIGKELGEHEISYIVLHYAAVIARYEQKTNGQAKIIVVCGSGIGSSKLVASKILERFDVNILGTYSSRNITSELENSCDYIISTVDIPSLNKDKYIKVSPLITSRDLEKLENYMHPIRKIDKGKNEILLLDRILGKIKKYCDIRDEEQLRYEILYEMKKQEEIEISNKEKQSLSYFIKKENIEIKLNCKDWKDVISKGADILIKKDYITEKYKEGIIEKLEEIGPYMVIAPGVCLSHVDMADEINRTSMSLINLKYPIKFNSEFNDPVRVVLTFATKDKESHLNALLGFMNLINNANDLNSLISASSKDEVIDIIKKY
ncbi:BglG family transcription antiterminator [Clostridium uliginosum]|uniref:Transcriptional antiterminator n=1 Tax=Clostridium uliginosum TaxID=119641 RepID=A0A1I1N7K8_9CLOT|nr:BglG family transcription antiterminator [Clostridium uliginosum]SFC93609.1 Transcriptional antiterminator [Clostridium uliginosum]